MTPEQESIAQRLRTSWRGLADVPEETRIRLWEHAGIRDGCTLDRALCPSTGRECWCTGECRRPMTHEEIAVELTHWRKITEAQWRALHEPGRPTVLVGWVFWRGTAAQKWIRIDPARAFPAAAIDVLAACGLAP